MYRGHSRDYHACDAPYHDIQHVLDVTLESPSSSVEGPLASSEVRAA
jgi:hypothetical protein